MAKSTGRDIAERFVRAIGHDDEAVGKLLHPDFVEEWPQSGERIRGWENLRRMLEAYPGRDSGGIGTHEVRDVAGAKDEWVMTPSFTPLHIEGTGDTYTVQSQGHYPDGSEWFVVHIIRLKDDKIFRVTTYFGPTFEAPEWRAPFVEPME